MKFSLNNIFKKNQIEDTVEAIINDIDDKPLAVSDSNVIYAAFGELGGYHFIQIIILGSLRIKTIKGAQLDIILNDFELNLNSDSAELTSDYSNVSGRFITRIDFQIEKEDIQKIETTKPSKFVLTVDKKIEEFKIYEGFAN